MGKAVQRGRYRHGQLASSDRRSNRYSKLGRDNEIIASEELEKATNPDGSPMFCNVVRHEPNSKEDQSGCDFTVSRVVDGETVCRSFGITISRRNLGEAKMKHPEVPQFHVPLGFNPQTLIRNVLKLFS